jgi:histidinol-phosphate aminotransferase
VAISDMPRSTDHAAPPPRPHLATVPIYAQGRSAEAAMAEHGITQATKMASNEVPFGPLPGVPEAVAAAMADASRYADHQADDLATAYAATIGVPRDHVAVGPGSVGLLQQLTLAYAGPDDQVLYPWPSFIAYPQFSGIVAADQVVVPLRRMSIDVDAVLAAITERTKVIFIANPNNPVSGALRRADMQRLVDEVPPTCLLVIDEAYHEFATGADVPDALTYLDGHPNIVVLRTLSKAYGMAALRVGFLIGDPTVVAAVYAALIPFAVNGPAQAAAMVALGQRGEVERRCALVVAERGRVGQTLRRSGLGLPEAQGNFWWLPAGTKSGDLAVALEQRGVVVRAFPTGIRVTVGTWDENDRFLDALTSVRAAHPHITGQWALPTGDRAVQTAVLLDRLDGALERLRKHAAAADHDGLTRPVPGESEQWDDGQVWAHIAEFGDYWLGELNSLLDAASDEPLPFGRTRRDAGRIAAIETGRGRSVTDQLATIERSADRLRTLLAELSDADWSRVGAHETLGAMDIDRQLDEFHIGHYEQHADQLDELTPG